MTRGRVPRHSLWIGSLVALVLLWAKLSESWSEPPGREQLVHIIGPLRVSEARLTGGFPWAPIHGKNRPEVMRELRRASRDLERSPARRSPEIQGNLGLLALVDSQYSPAIDRFARAVKKAPGDAALLID